MLRQAKLSDAELLASLFHDAFAAEEVPSLATVERGLQAENSVTLIIEVEGKPAGFAANFLSLSLNNTPRWEIDLLGVAPLFRKRGLAKQLVLASVAEGRKHGVQMARALTRVENHPVHHTFSSCGFQSDHIHHTLMIGSHSNTLPATPLPDDAYLLPVTTLSYAGFWLEGKLSPQALQAAASAGHPLVGCVMPQANSGLLEAARSAGFSSVGDFQWWEVALFTQTPTKPAAKPAHRQAMQ